MSTTQENLSSYLNIESLKYVVLCKPVSFKERQICFGNRNFHLKDFLSKVIYQCNDALNSFSLKSVNEKKNQFRNVNFCGLMKENCFKISSCDDCLSLAERICGYCHNKQNGKCRL